MANTYDGVSNRTVLVDMDGLRTSYAYDGQDGLSQVRDLYQQGDVSHYTSGPIGRVNLPVTFAAGGLRLETNYDQAGRLVRTQQFRAVPSIDTQSTRDAADRLTAQFSVGLSGEGGRVSYTYDKASQVINERRSAGVDASGFNATYTYDPAGNRVLLNNAGVLTSYTYDGANQLVQEVTGSSVTTYTYDAAGNRTLKNEAGALTTLTWDEENRLVGMALPDGNRVTNTYAADALRRKTQDSTGTKQFVYDGSRLLLEKDGTGATQVRYTGDPDGYGPWWQTRGIGAGASTQFVGQDVPGNVRLLVSKADGSHTDEYAYPAFGPVRASSGTTANRFKFGGVAGYQDDGLGTGLLKVGFRWYDELTGRWISVDPSGFKDPNGFESEDRNLYAYVENDPINWVDPDGNRRVRINYPNVHPCVSRSIHYCLAAQRMGWSNNAFNGFCYVSANLCLSVIAPPIYPSRNTRAHGDCINRCLYNHWLDRDTFAWLQAARTCTQCGQSSSSCCAACIRAEQKAFTSCSLICRGRYGYWNMTIPAPPWRNFPFNGNEANRIYKGIQLVCLGSAGSAGYAAVSLASLLEILRRNNGLPAPRFTS